MLVTLVSGDAIDTVDAGFVTPAVVGDFVWDDLDGDGVQDVGEPGVAGVVVELLDAAGGVVDSTVTAGDGSYQFVGVVPGGYRVRFVAPAGFGLTAKDQGGDDTVDSDPDSVTGETGSFLLISGQSVDSIDAGVVAGASIGDRVWYDFDGDGVQDAGEPGAAGIAVTLLDAGGAVLDSTTTAANGGYQFTGLAPGDYAIRIDSTVNFTAQDQGPDDALDSDVDAAGISAAITLTSGATVSDVDAGVLPPSIGDFVWVDSDGDGVQDPGEPGLAGVTVELLDGAGTVVDSTATAADGSYLLDEFVPGTYTVRFVAPAGFVFTAADASGDDSADSDVDSSGSTSSFIISATDDIVTVDAGVFETAGVGDRVWDDLDGDGVQDPGEPGVGGVTVELLDAGGATIDSTTTAADGTYGFSGLTPGTYTLNFAAPVGAAPTGADAGGDDAVDSDVDGSGSVLVTLVSGDAIDTVDAGFVTPAVVGDFVWDDLDGDGVQDVGEPGVAGVVVELLDAAGGVVDSTVTAGDGSYQFVGVVPGGYRVRFVAPAGFGLTAKDQGGDDTVDSDAFVLTGRTEVFSVVSGDVIDSVDAGVVADASIGDRVWFDVDSDGVQGSGEPGVGGVTVDLLDAGGAVVASTTTAGDGSYVFGGLWPGEYSVAVDPSLSFTTRDAGADDAVDSDVDALGETGTVTLTSGATVSDVDAGVVPSSIGDRVWVDSDGDGRQDAGESGVAGVTVELLDAGGAVVASTTTAGDGSYGFGLLLPGDYGVRFAAPAGFVFTVADAGVDTLDSDADASGLTATMSLPGATVNNNVDAGVFETAGVGDRVWDDLDGDGVQDPGEPGVGGVTVELLDAGGATIDSTTTAADGTYGFSGLTPGTYTLNFAAPSFAFVPADAGADDDLDSDVDPATGLSPTFDLTSGQSDVSIDAGVQPARIGDRVWDDLDGDGVQDVGEPGVSGVIVNLLDAGGAVLESTTTAATGTYRFDVVPGVYEIEFVAPPGTTFTDRNAGADDSVDSDADPATGRTGAISVVGSTVHTTSDAGIVAPASIGDFVWQDLDADGVQDPAEVGLDGVTVRLFDGATLVASSATAGGGLYSFTGLAPGNYTVDVDDASVPAGYVLTTTDPLSASVTSGQDLDSIDFGYEPTGSVQIVKNPASQAVVSGGSATFTITVANTGASTIDNISVSDALAPDCDGLLGTLPAGASTSFTCSLAGVTAGFTNTADVTAQGPGGISLTDSDTAEVTVDVPGVSITKDPPTQLVVTGGTASFTITVTNSGNADLTDVVVSDPLAPLCDNAVGDLAIGESTSYGCDLIGVVGDFTNTATVSAEDPIGGVLNDSDTAAVDMISPSIEITKGPAGQNVVPGDTASFTISVTNTGDADLTDVNVSDPLAPLCDNAIGDLAVGESRTYGCDIGNVTAGFTNTADVIGEDPTGGAVSDSDSADVRLLAPSVGIAKNPVDQTVVTGGTVTFEITVVNNGDAPLTAATVSDPLAPLCDNAIGDLAVGASVTYNCDLAGVISDLTNTASVTADDQIGNPVSASDTADVDVINPAIRLEKDPPSQAVVTGRTATFSMTVTNVGDVDLTNVNVSDPLAPACDNVIGDLAVGASVTYNCDLAAVAADFTNTATAIATDPTGGSVEDIDTADVTVLTPSIAISKSPANQQILSGDSAAFAITVTNDGDADLTNVNVSDPLAPLCGNAIGDLAVGASVAYNCDLAAVTADFTNVVNVVGTDPAGGSVPATDTAAVDVIDPEIRIEKNPGSQNVLPGGTASFSITVTNTGDVDLTNVNVSDPLTPACDNAVGGLTVGASVTYSCDLAGVTSDFTNIVDVVGSDPLASTVSDSDSAGVNVLIPNIGIDKTTSTPQVVVGGTATFTITVTNTGTAPLTDVVVSDPQAPDCDQAIGDLDAGATSSYACTLAGLLGDTTNTATVTGSDGGGGTVSDADSEPVDVISPDILIAKTPNTQSVIVNGTADFTITVTNVGDVPLSDVEVVDALAPACDRTIGDVAASASITYNCDLAAVTSDFTNSATVTGDHPVSGPVQSTDTADVTILTPGIDITKTAVDSVVRYGSDAVFDILVTNSGQTDLTNVEVVDSLTPDCDNAIGDLALGAAVSYSCTLLDVTADVVNSATVNGADAVANAVSDTDTAAVTVITPAVEIAKSPDLQQVLAGATATFDITVTNQGDVPLTGIVVTDPLAPDCDRTLADLAAFESTAYSCTLAGVVADLVNTATVDASDPLGGSLTDDDDAAVDVVNPGVDIQKTPDAQTVLSGDVATFTITVTNDGDQDITDATVSDPAVPNCDLASTGPLAVGESISYTCDSDALTADLVNIVSVDGVDVLGNPASDSDDAAVDVIDPSLTIDKTPDAQAVVVGGDVSFTITVANTGDADLSAVEVVDPFAPDCDLVIGDLAAGASSTHSCTLSPVASDFTNTADVTAVDELGNPWSSTDTADVTVLTPALDLVKGPAYQVVNTGGDAIFTITVTNSGQTPLSSVTVTDGQAPLCDRILGDLAVGESVTYSCALAGATADFVNTASGSGRDPIGGPVVDEDTAIVDVISPALTISKTPDSQTVLAGDDVTFEISVTNVGDVALTDVTVTDPMSTSCDRTIGDLLPGASVDYSCILAGVTASFTNVADVAGTDSGGGPVADSDTADVTVIQIGSVTGLVFLDADADAGLQQRRCRPRRRPGGPDRFGRVGRHVDGNRRRRPLPIRRRTGWRLHHRCLRRRSLHPGRQPADHRQRPSAGVGQRRLRDCGDRHRLCPTGGSVR